MRKLTHPSGVELDISDFGAQLMGWRVGGVEQLYTSPLVDYANGKPLRGGVPICFPQFNQRVIDGRVLPKHGFARTAAWHFVFGEADAAGIRARLSLSHRDLSAELRDVWPFEFEAFCHVQADAKALKVEIELRNLGSEPLPFALALHTYLRVDNVSAASLHGLEGSTYWDAVAHLRSPEKRKADQQPLSFGTETDRVYANAPRTVSLRDGSRAIQISASESLPDTVVWNPGPALCAQLADMPADGWQHMLCVEAAAIEQPISPAPGASWRGWQEISLN